MLLVPYGRIGIYVSAGNVVECRYCMHLGAQLDDGSGRANCVEHNKLTPLTARCTSFWREVGTDDA